MKPLALVTGASSGIGLELAKGLAARGHDIVGVGTSERVQALPGTLTGVEVTPEQVDLATDGGVAELWSRVEALDRPLEVACLNAGRSLGGAFLDTDLEDERAMIALNITSQVVLAKHVVTAMAARRQGRILITSSLSATTPTPYESIYGPTRAFMASFAQGLREEMREHGVSVTALLPGATATSFHQSAGMGNTVFGSNDWKNDPALVARLGLDALFAGKDHVVGGDRGTRIAAARTPARGCHGSSPGWPPRHGRPERSRRRTTACRPRCGATWPGSPPTSGPSCRRTSSRAA